MYSPDPLLLASLDVVKATKVVTFNAAADLNLSPAILLVASNVELAPVETKFDAGTQRTTLIFAEELPAGSKATLLVGFESALIDSMTGYYKSTWEKGTYALTQFEVRVWPVHTYTGSGISFSKWWCQRALETQLVLGPVAR
jgi:aminopeptidase 2